MSEPAPVLAPYMHWAKTRPVTTFDLAASNMLACAVEDVPGARDALALSARNDEGYAPLQAAIAAHCGVAPERIVHAIGCSGANFLVYGAHLTAGDDVLMERPGYDPMAGGCRLLGATVRFVDRPASAGFAVDVDDIRRRVTARTRLIILTSPHNPSGAVLDRPTLEALDRLAAETGVAVLIDEAYLDIARLLAPTPDAAPRASVVGPHLISTCSLTKSFGLNALRCGWAVVPSAAVATRLRRIRDVVDVVGPAPTDILAALAFQHLTALGARALAHTTTNLTHVRAFLDRHPELVLDTPIAATILFPRLDGTADTDAFVRMAAERYDVTVVPGGFFDAPAHLRLSVAGTTANLAGGLARLDEALAAR